MRAPLDNPSLGDDEDLIRLAHGRKSVRDDDRRSPDKGGLEGQLHRHLRLRVEVGRRLVEHHDIGCLEQQAGDGEPLLLPSREPVTAVTDEGVEALRQ